MTRDIRRYKAIDKKSKKHNYSNFSYHDEKFDLCMYCEKLVRIDTRQMHNQTQKHLSLMRKYYEGEYYECKDCPYKGLSLQYLLKHILKYAHAPLKPYEYTNTPLVKENTITTKSAEHQYYKEPLKNAILTIEI